MTNGKWYQIQIWSMKKYLIFFHLHSLFHFNHKTEKFRFWKSFNLFIFLIFLIKKDVTSDLNMSHWKICFISIIRVCHNHKTEEFWFWKSLKCLIFLFKKSQIWICTVKQHLILFKLFCLNRSLAIRWGIQILNFIEIFNIFQFRNLLSDQNLPWFLLSYLYFLASL